MKKLILGTLAVVTLGLTPAFAEEHGHAGADASVSVSAETTATGTAMPTETVASKNIADMIAADAQFSTLVSALTAAGSMETLKGEGPYTMFAPTNEAFEKLGADALADLMKPENKDKLAAILKYHVVSGKMAATDVKGATELATLNGASLKVDGKGDVVKIGGATVSKADMMASNGTVHVIDTVLMPPAEAPKTE